MKDRDEIVMAFELMSVHEVDLLNGNHEGLGGSRDSRSSPCHQRRSPCFPHVTVLFRLLHYFESCSVDGLFMRVRGCHTSVWCQVEMLKRGKVRSL